MRVTFIVLLLLVACNPTPEVPKKWTGKGKIHGELNERLSPCRLKAVEKSTDLEDHWVCVYDHPKSEVDDRVTICYECKCPKTVYCDLR
tara:strand:- start:356 stop:622 length:267 start_codon:yes stop_codon:yes gene_type:complete